MKIRSLKLNNYKRYRREPDNPWVFHFTEMPDQQAATNEITLVVGDNGSGKSSLLQAVALLVGSAVRNQFQPEDLSWPGFHYPYIQNGRFPVLIEAELEFTQEEVEATIAYVQELNNRFNGNLLLPTATRSATKRISIRYDYVQGKVVTAGNTTTRDFFLTKGHQYAKQLAAAEKSYGERFKKVGNIIWYNEQRTSDSITKYLMDSAPSISIKRLIADWYYMHKDIERGERQLREGQYDKFKILKELYEKVFQGRKLGYATLQKGGGNDIDVIFIDESNNEYDFTEMSAGERAIFPLLLDFANQNINNSIVIIDELELHLHPPLQLHFLQSLSKMGTNNQFIITTHSPFVASQFSDYQKIVL
jgi:AAA15 family ATPase/GTPase